eukprot:RCo014269
MGKKETESLSGLTERASRSPPRPGQARAFEGLPVVAAHSYTVWAAATWPLTSTGFPELDSLDQTNQIGAQSWSSELSAQQQQPKHPVLPVVPEEVVVPVPVPLRGFCSHLSYSQRFRWPLTPRRAHRIPESLPASTPMPTTQCHRDPTSRVPPERVVQRAQARNPGLQKLSAAKPPWFAAEAGAARSRRAWHRPRSR